MVRGRRMRNAAGASWSGSGRSELNWSGNRRHRCPLRWPAKPFDLIQTTEEGNNRCYRAPLGMARRARPIDRFSSMSQNAAAAAVCHPPGAILATRLNHSPARERKSSALLPLSLLPAPPSPSLPLPPPSPSPPPLTLVVGFNHGTRQLRLPFRLSPAASKGSRDSTSTQRPPRITNSKVRDQRARRGAAQSIVAYACACCSPVEIRIDSAPEPASKQQP